MIDMDWLELEAHDRARRDLGPDATEEEVNAMAKRIIEIFFDLLARAKRQ